MRCPKPHDLFLHSDRLTLLCPGGAQRGKLSPLGEGDRVDKYILKRKGLTPWCMAAQTQDTNTVVVSPEWPSFRSYPCRDRDRAGSILLSSSNPPEPPSFPPNYAQFTSYSTPSELRIELQKEDGAMLIELGPNTKHVLIIPILPCPSLPVQ